MPFFLITLLIFAATTLLGELMRPKQAVGAAASLKDFSFPTADATRSIPVVWGTVKLDAPNVVWYGDLQSQQIYKKIRSLLIFSTKQHLGYRYYVGMHLALCYGPIDALVEIRSEDKVGFTGNVTSGDFQVNNTKVFGGDSEDEQLKNGEGGWFANCTLYPGTSDQAVDPYLQAILTNVPAYRDVAHVVWKGPDQGGTFVPIDSSVNVNNAPYYSGYVGINPKIKPMNFVVKRLPNFLNPAYKDINNGDANPVDIIWELLINNDFGMGLSSIYLDSASFTAAQQTVYADGLGFSGIWDSPKPISDVISEVLKLIDAVLYVDVETGLITLKLIRGDYDLGSLPIFDEDSIVEISSFSRSSWDETTNEIKLTFTDRMPIETTDNTMHVSQAPPAYHDNVAVAQDLANASRQGAIVSSAVTYNGVSNSTVAQKIAQRDLKVLSSTLAKCTVKINRKGMSLRPGSVFKLNWPDYGITNMPMRVGRVRYGEYDNGMMEIDAVQDIFGLATPVYSTFGGTGWSNPVGASAVPTTFFVYEAPWAFSNSDYRLQIFTVKENSSQFSYNTSAAIGSISGTYSQISAGDPFTPSGTLTGNYPLLTNDVDTTNTITLSSGSYDTLKDITNATADDILKGNNLAVIKNSTAHEIIAFENIVNNNDGTYTLSNIWRGLFDTVPQAFVTGNRLYMFSYGDAYPETTFTDGDDVYVKTQSVAGNDTSALSSAYGLTIKQRAVRPYPPGKIQINGSTSPSTISAGDITVAWEHRNRLTQGTNINKQFDTGIDLEPRATYELKFYNATNTLLRTVSDITTNTYTYTSANQIADNSGSEPNVVTVQIYTLREGVYSFFAQQRTVTRSGGVAPAPLVYSIPGGDAYNPAPPGDAASIAGIPVSQSTPSSNTVPVYNSSTNTWEYGYALPKIQTVFASSTNTHTTNNTWEDINSMSITSSVSSAGGVLHCSFTCEVSGTTAAIEDIAFRFSLDGSTFSEVWNHTKKTFPANDEKLLITVHTAFTGVAAGSHTIKAQWNDNNSGLDVDFYDRRLTVVLGN